MSVLARAFALVALLLAAPGAQAFAATLDLESARPVGVDGALLARFDGGVLRARGAGADATFSGAVGTVHVWSETARVVDAAGRPVAVGDGAPPEGARWRVDGADLALFAEGAPLDVTAVAAAGGAVRVEAPRAAGVPRVLARDEGAVAVGSPSAPEAANVAWTWRAGWTYAGDLAGPDRDVGFPAEAARVGLEGPVRLALAAGRLEFVDADGAARVVELGERREAGDPADALAPRVRRTWVVFEGALADADLRPHDAWGVAAPAASWQVEGSVTWRGATGTVARDGAARAVHDATVVAQGALAVAPAPAGPGAPAAYRAEGDLDVLAVDGAPVEAASAARAAAAGGAALAAALLLAAAARWVILPLYTRLAAQRLLEHAKRRRIYDEARAADGLPQRELHRRVGGAWGPFSFHLRMLERAGYLRLERQGKYTLVFARGAPAGGPAIPHPVARLVYEAVPAEGGVAAVDLGRTLGLSRELLAYHLRTLERRGLVRSWQAPDRRRFVARA